MAAIQLRQLRKVFAGQEVVRGLDLDIASNEFLVLVGPSGCGKSTTLRMVAGLESITSGEIRIAERRVNDVPARDRDIAMVFQNYALFPHMTVHQNLSFGMRIRKVPREEIERRVTQAAEILGITELLQRRPKQLSGGQRQRVAMGRAILRDPKVSLFDEPLSNLDAQLRIQMRAEIRKVHQRVPTTVMYVTHDQVEAMTLADRIAVMNRGRIEQVGAPQELYDRPATQFVAGFIGSPPMNFIPCRLELEGDHPTVQLVGGPRLSVPAPRVERYTAYAGRDMTFGIRPEHLTERRAHVNAFQTDFEAQIEAREPMGNDTMLYFSLAGVPVCARASPASARNIGETMPLTIDMNAMQLIDPETGKVIAV